MYRTFTRYFYWSAHLLLVFHVLMCRQANTHSLPDSGRPLAAMLCSV